MGGGDGSGGAGGRGGGTEGGAKYDKMHTTVMSHFGVSDSTGVVAGATATLVAVPKLRRPALNVDTKEDATTGGV